MKPHLTLKRMLVHLKDKCTSQENSGVVYQVPSKDCQDIYTDVTERRYGVREKEQIEILRHWGKRGTLDQGRKTH